MASLRKRYRPDLQSPIAGNEPLVLSPPQGGDARLPDPVETKPPEPMEATSPAAAAGTAAIRQRLAEMEKAEQLARGQHQQRPASEPPPQQQPAAMPAAVQKWLADHPQYLDPRDQVAAAEIQLATMKCIRDGKTWHDDDFIPTIERHLGLAPASNGQPSAPAPTPMPAPTPAPASQPLRRAAPVRQYGGPPVSAPPTRESPSLATGRPTSHRAPLTRDEIEIALACKIEGEPNETAIRRYSDNKEKMERMKMSGEIQNAGSR